jgi:hypothetical protein
VLARGFWASGDRGGGWFFWDAASSEPDDGGTVIRPSAAGTGPGRWKRIMDDDRYNVRWFGARGDRKTLDDAAFSRAIACLEALPSPGATLYVPAGWYLLSRTLVIRRTMKLRGDGGDNYGGRSRLRWTVDGIDGIYIRERVATDSFRADATRIEDLIIQGSHRARLHKLTAAEMDTPRPGPGSGIVFKAAQVKLRNLLVVQWKFDGVQGTAFTKHENANHAAAQDLMFYSLGRHGVYMAGENASGGYFIGVFGTGPLSGYTWYDRGFFGNTYLASHSEGAAHSFYSGTSKLNATTVLGAYQEASDGPAQLSSYTTAVGGTWGNSFEGHPSFLGTDVRRGRGLSGGLANAPARPPTEVVVRGQTLPPSSFEHHRANAGLDSHFIYDCTHGRALVVLQDPAGIRKGSTLLFKVRPSRSEHFLRLQVLGGKRIDGAPSLDLKPGQAVWLQSDGTEWSVIGKAL